MHVGLSAVQPRPCADSSLRRPTSGVPCSTCRCRLLKSTTSKSTRPRRPTPAAARYSAAGEPSPPAPMQQHARRLQLALPVHAHLGHDQVAAVALHLLVAQGAAAPATAASPLPPATDGMMLTVSPAFSGVCFLLQVADVLVVQVDVDEAPQPPIVAVEVTAQVGVAARQGRERLADGAALHLHGVELVGVRAAAASGCKSSWASRGDGCAAGWPFERGAPGLGRYPTATVGILARRAPRRARARLI